MIRLDDERRRGLVDQLRSEGHWPEGASAALMERLLSTVGEPQFPGAIVPRHMNGQYRYYLVASTEPDWRMLRPLAMAFVGRTISSFDGAQTEFDERDPLEALLIGAGLIGALVLATGATKQDRRRVGEALDELRMLATVARGKPPELRTTADILRDFRLALAIRDRAAAEQAIDLLRGNLRLDGLNQIFMRIEVDAALEAWPDLWRRSYYVDACHALRPPRVTAGLARAAYWTILADTAAEGDLGSLLKVFRSNVAPRCQGLFSGLPPSYTPDVVLPFLLGWELASIDVAVPAELRAEIETWPTGERTVARLLLDGARTPGPEPEPLVGADVLAELSRLVFAAVLRRTPEALDAAHDALMRADGLIVQQLRETDAVPRCRGHGACLRASARDPRLDRMGRAYPVHR